MQTTLIRLINASRADLGLRPLRRGFAAGLARGPARTLDGRAAHDDP